MFKKALVPLDDTELSEGILPFVSQLAKGLNIPLVLMTAVDINSLDVPERLKEGPPIIESGGGMVGPVVRSRPAEFAGEPLYATQIWENVEDKAKQRLRRIANELSEKEGLQAETVVVFGEPAREIVRAAHEQECDLIAMSTHGRSMMGTGVLGGVTNKVVHTSHLPVLTIAPDKAEKYWNGDAAISNIMLPLDGSELAETAIPYVEYIAKKMSLEVMLVRVARTDGNYSGEGDASRLNDSDMVEEGSAMSYLENMANRFDSEGIQTLWKLRRGSPAKEIVELAHETPQDLIVLTSHGRTGLTRWIRGSVAEALVRASGDPVLVIPPMEVQKSEDPESAWDKVLPTRARYVG